MSDVLFTVKEENLETGLRGYPVGYCTTSFVDPEKGLFYVGKPISQMENAKPIEIIYLLYHGKEGSGSEIKAFDEEIKKRSSVDKGVIDAICALPKKGHPMDLFSAAIQILGMFEGKNDYREDCLNLIAKIPIIAAAVINHHAGWKREDQIDTSLSYMERFTKLLGCEKKDPKIFSDVMRLFNVLHLDHGGGNLSAFTGKTVASGLQHMYGAISASMNSLAGPKHGRANQDCLEFVQQILQEAGENVSAEELEKIIHKRLESGGLIFGFGHAVLRVEDPRATIFHNFTQKHFPNHPLVKMAALLREVGVKVLKENPKISNPYPNVDQVSGTALTAAGFPYPEYYTILFGLSRAVGIAIQIVYERCEAREKKGCPIVRPKYLYKARRV